MMPMEKDGDLSASGSGEGFCTKRKANEEAALKSIHGLKDHHGIAYRDINYDELVAEREEKMIALTSMKDFMNERDVLMQENTELRDSYKTVVERYLATQYIYKENSSLRDRIAHLEKDIHTLMKGK